MYYFILTYIKLRVFRQSFYRAVFVDTLQERQEVARSEDL